jgi:predicted metallopeptidase
VSRVDVAVAVAEDAQGRIYEVAAACRALGLQHTATLAVVGVLTGSMESGDLARLWAIPGVLAVEVKRDFRWGITARIRCRRGCAD